MPIQEFNGLRGTKETLDEVVKRLKAVTVKVGQVDQKAFPRVERFSSLDLEKALRAMLAAEGRIALVIYDEDRFEDLSAGTELRSAQSRNIDVLVSDRVMGDSEKAIFGDGANHPGTLAMADAVKTQLSGLLFENPKGIFLRPLGSEPIEFSDTEKKNLPGRRAEVVRFIARGGLLTKDLKGVIQ